MVARAAKLCGLETAMTSAETQSVLSQYGDYRSVADWAKEPVAFCCASGIFDAGAGYIRPTTSILRGEIAQMLYNMLSAAELI